MRTLPAMMTALLGVTTASYGAIVVQYDFPTTAGTTLPSASTDSDAGTNASALSVGWSGAGISSSAGNPINSLFAKGVNNSTEAFAFQQDKYFAFTVTPLAGGVSFASLNFDVRRDASGSSTQYALYASTGAFTSGNHLVVGSLPSTTAVFTAASIDLGTLAPLQGVTAPITFRFYTWGASGDGGSEAITRFDNIVLSATVPEPGTALLLGGTALLGLRRRRTM